MKKIDKILFSLVLILVLSCNEKNIESTLVIEKNNHNSLNEISLSIDTTVYTPAELDEKLVFSLSPKKSAYYQLEIGDNKSIVFIAPGDSIFISFKTVEADNDIFSGTGNGVLINNYILNDKKYSEQINNETDFDSIYSLGMEDFVKNIDQLYGLRETKLKEFISKNNIKDEIFITTEQKRLMYDVSMEKNLYYRDHKFLTEQIPILDDKFNSYIENVNFNDSAMLFFKEYRNFLYSYFESKALQECDLEKNRSKEILTTEIAFKNAIEKIKNKKTLGYTLYRIMDVHLNETPIDLLGNLINDFNKYCSNINYKYNINNYYNKLRKLKKGMPAPDFTFPNKNGKEFSLSDFKGKLVYIDIWNSNCSPCFKEFPILDKIISRYLEEEIVFLGISYDSDENLWKNTLEKKELKGIQIYANGWNSQFGKDYLVYSNPRFILIDKKGNFINAKAPKPSENIEEIIDENINN